ncbi:MAG: osmosensitive channel signal transduction histidine kinase [Solirubrobacterales bacterium]|nr:osmosensitive channel signal transduction histidine kinase [Solirubrobacterales bacterium]
MSISARITHVRAEDLLDEEVGSRSPRRPSLSTRRQLTGVAIGAVALPLLTVVLDEAGSRLSLESEVLLYLLVVLAIAIVGGLGAAVLAAVAGALLINYFFVAPVHTLDVAQTDQAVALVVFLAVAVTVSLAMEVVTRRTRAAELARAQAETLSTLAGADLDESETLRGILDRARETFGMESVLLKARDQATGVWDEVERAGWGSEQPLRFDVPIGSDLRLVGRGPALFAEDQRVLNAFAAAAQTAYEGRRLSARARQAESLAVVDRQRTALLTAVGHDLRTPLAAIKASATTLRQHDVEWSAEDREELLATIEESVDRLNGIVGNLLDASRLEAGALTVRPQAVTLDQVVGAALLGIPGSGGAVTVDVPEDLPAVRADPGLLERVLVNLIDNAVRYGGGRVEIVATAGAESAKIAIVDHGPGVPSEQRAALFVPVARRDDRRAVSGMGLGLSVAKGFTEAMGGALVADGSDGGGLTMRLRLPLA